MRRIRFVALGIVSFVVSIFGALLAPGTFLNRALSAALCTVFSFNSAVCTASLVQSSERVVAATPPAVERSIADISGYLQAQRDPSEFGDEPSAPTPGSNPQAPPFPQDPGPNFPLRRPDFDGIDQNSQQIVNTPRDFVLISQTNPSREKREILFKSPSTGAEQIQVVTPVGAEEFKLFEIEFRNLPGTDQPRTRNFKISFDEGVIAKVTLGDGSNAVIRQDNVIVTTPNGQVQSIPIPRNQTSINNGMIGSNYFNFTENLETSCLLKSENNLSSKEECVKKILNEYKIIEGRVKLAYNLMLLAASVWLGLTTGGTGGVIAGAILEAIGLALQQALEEAKILSDYDEYKRKQAEEMCKQTQQPTPPQQAAVTARISQIDDVATIYIDGREVKKGGYAGGGKGGDTGWGPIDVGSGTHQVRLVVNNTLAGGSGGWFEIKVNGQLKINQGRPLQEDRVTGIKYDTTTTLEVP